MDTHTPEARQAGERRMDLLDVLLIFGRRKWIILGCAAVFAVGAIVITVLQPRLYRSVATILPPQQEQSGSSLLNQLGALSALTGGSLGVKSQADLYVSILETNIVAQDMVERFHLMDAYNIHDHDGAAGMLRKRSKFTAGKDGLIQIVVEDKDAKRAAVLAAGFAEELFHQNNRLAIGSASQRRLFFQQQLDQEKDRLADAEVALKQTQQSTGVLQLSGQAANILRAEAELQANITSHEVQLAALLSSSTEQNPEVIRVRSELAGLRTQLTELQKGSGGSTLSQAQFPTAGLEYVRKERDVKYHETLFELLARQLEAAHIDEAKASPTVQLVDPPRISKTPSWPRPILFLLIGVVLGLIVGCCLCVVLWLYDYVDTDPHLSPRFALLKRTMRLRA
jgi:tyrosine-protein kinase Etk/Wzc